MTRDRLKIAVGAITRRRPAMFAELLDSLAKMRMPEGAEIQFLFAENDDSTSVQQQVEEFAARTGCAAKLELQPRPGIPMARNTVLDMAIAEGCDLLTFVDDDEIVTEDWLVNLVDTVERRKLDLAGGPVHLIAGDAPMTRSERVVLEFLQKRARKQNRKRAEWTRGGTDAKQDIYTNNWCARLATVQALGIRFNEALQYTGGSDTRFSLDMRAAGARLGWVPEAIVQEKTPPKRLSLPYQFRRARDQSANGVRMRRVSLSRVLSFALLRYFDAVINVMVSPFAGRVYLVKGVYKAGTATGRLKGFFGAESRHYAPGSERFHTEAQTQGGEGRS